MDSSTEKYVAVDFKLVILGGGGGSSNGGNVGEEFLSMIVLATITRIAIFDLANSDSILMESGLKELLESNIVLKVINNL